jgi:hypothetical protein
MEGLAFVASDVTVTTLLYTRFFSTSLSRPALEPNHPTPEFVQEGNYCWVEAAGT